MFNLYEKMKGYGEEMASKWATAEAEYSTAERENAQDDLEVIRGELLGNLTSQKDLPASCADYIVSVLLSAGIDVSGNAEAIRSLAAIAISSHLSPYTLISMDGSAGVRVSQGIYLGKNAHTTYFGLDGRHHKKTLASYQYEKIEATPSACEENFLRLIAVALDNTRQRETILEEDGVHIDYSETYCWMFDFVVNKPHGSDLRNYYTLDPKFYRLWHNLCGEMYPAEAALVGAPVAGDLRELDLHYYKNMPQPIGLLLELVVWLSYVWVKSPMPDAMQYKLGMDIYSLCYDKEGDGTVILSSDYSLYPGKAVTFSQAFSYECSQCQEPVYCISDVYNPETRETEKLCESCLHKGLPSLKGATCGSMVFCGEHRCQHHPAHYMGRHAARHALHENGILSKNRFLRNMIQLQGQQVAGYLE